MIALKILSKIFKALRSNQSPAEIAWGFVLGMLFGITPLFNMHHLLLLAIVIIFRVNIAMFFAGFILFSILAFPFDPLFHSFGYYLLTGVPALQPIWRMLADSPVLAWSNFNNTIVMGSLAIGLLLIVPLFFLARKGVLAYRNGLEERVKKMKIVQIMTGSKLYRLYEKINQLGD